MPEIEIEDIKFVDAEVMRNGPLLIYAKKDEQLQTLRASKDGSFNPFFVLISVKHPFNKTVIEPVQIGYDAGTASAILTIPESDRENSDLHDVFFCLLDFVVLDTNADFLAVSASCGNAYKTATLKISR